ncbi:MAG: enoyl-CoA hydratase-related protein [Gammaproteobacteria bacterium]|nr:enoyl-CoA hydratase-related protein [Gammaproteobacteria bacterium]
MQSYRTIEFEIDDPVAVIRLNRPDRLNAFTYEMLDEIRSAVEAAAADARVVGIVITGNGRGFSAGLDAEVLQATTEGRGQSSGARTERDPDELPGMFSYLLQIPKPVIAAVNGVAAGGGVILALASDVRFASTAAAFTTVFLKRGLISEHGSSWLLPRMVGVGRALDLLWTSDKIDGTRAHEIGLVEYLTEPDELEAAARAYVQRLATDASPAAMAETKHLVYRHLGTDHVTALHEADRSTQAFVGRPDAKEGAMSLIEKRPARFERIGEDHGD